MKTSILILAAGTSSRMGKAKQLLPYKHTTLLGWAIEQAQASNTNEILCVLGANIEEIKTSIRDYGIDTIHNPNYSEGLSSSIKSGVHAQQESDAVLVMLTDQPNITYNYLNKLLEKHREFPNTIIATNYRGAPGVPAIFPKKFYPELLRLKGDKGAKEFLNTLANEIIIEEAIVDFRDIDFPEDYRRLNGKKN